MWIAAALLAVGLAAAPAAAVNLVSATRTVEVDVVGGANTPPVTSSLFGAFDELVSDDGNLEPGLPYHYQGYASQQSDVGATQISAYEEVFLEGIMRPPLCPGCVPGSSSALLDVVFDVTTPQPWSLSGELFAEEHITGTLAGNEVFARVTLTPNGGAPIAAFQLALSGSGNGPQTLPVWASGVLPPGRYRYQVDAFATHPLGAPIVAGTAHVIPDLTLDLPTPAVPASPALAVALLGLALLAAGTLALPRRA